jgi:hypothetical protein
MLLNFEDRHSDSPFVERVWQSRSSQGGGVFYSMAEVNVELVVIRLPRVLSVILRGPVTKPSAAECPPNGEWLAVRFRPGVFAPTAPSAALANHNNLTLPVIDNRRFLFAGTAWEIPSFENVEVFVGRFARAGLLARDDAVNAVLSGDRQPLHRRSLQRRFLNATGMTHDKFRQIQRARYAVRLLRSGYSILDTVHSAGYFDQPHLTRSLRQLIGLTPQRIAVGADQLSFSYKTCLSDEALVAGNPPRADLAR